MADGGDGEGEGEGITRDKGHHCRILRLGEFAQISGNTVFFDLHIGERELS